MTNIRVDLDWLFDEVPITDQRFLNNLVILHIDICEYDEGIGYLILEGPLLSFDLFQQIHYDNGLTFEEFISTHKI